jgi:hypothetical protein
MTINKCHIQVLVVEAAVLMLGAVLIFIVAWARTVSKPTRAQAFLSDFLKLEVGKSNFEEAKVVAQQHGGIPWYLPDGSMRCTYQGCAFCFAFENKPLTSIHVVPYVGFTGILVLKNGVLTERNIHYVRYSKRPFAYNVRETQTVLPEGDTSEAQGMRHLVGLARMQVDPAGVASAISIGLESSSSADQRRRAYALDLSCLSKLFGRGNASLFFPRNIPYQGPPLQTHTETW